MLYVTTRNKTDSYTDYRTIFADFAPNGGQYLPLRIPKLEKNQIKNMKQQSFGQTVAFILNLFFNGRISAWDVDCSIGKIPAKIISTNQRVFLAKLWDNPSGDYNYICKQIYKKLSSGERLEPTNWASTAIRISVIFGLYGMMCQNQIHNFDLCICSENHMDITAALYARYMGLPSRKIICSCNDNGSLWELFHRGELNCATLSDNDDLREIEQLIYVVLGYDQMQKFTEAFQSKQIFRISSENLMLLNDALFVSVVGNDRAESIISTFSSANNVILNSSAALSFGGLQDFRSKTGESVPALLLWDRSAVNSIPVTNNN